MTDIKDIQSLVRQNKLETTIHAEEEREEEEISYKDIKDGLLNGEILEDYPNDPRGHSCLILGYDKNKRPIHVVCGIILQKVLRIITVYIPKPPKWIDPRTRVKKE